MSFAVESAHFDLREMCIGIRLEDEFLACAPTPHLISKRMEISHMEAMMGKWETMGWVLVCISGCGFVVQK